MTDQLIFTQEVAAARIAGKPIVALESTVITHGLPYPHNLNLAMDMENTVREHGAIPATIGVVEGEIHIGLNHDHLALLAQSQDVYKISVRDFGPAIAFKRNGGTTVAGTLFAAHKAGLSVFATGGIGGVHRLASADTGVSRDVSTDLTQLSLTPMVVVCAGAKAILDLPATVEMLETLGVPVVGFQTREFPAFYSISSGLPVSLRVESPAEAAQIAATHWGIGLHSAVLVTAPPPAETALAREVVDVAIETALSELQAQGIHGQAVTPYLLKRVTELTTGHSQKANLALLLNNARIAAQIAVHLCH